ncbi:MAG: hypothetical protein FD164_947 [Nitrospirae bacterium]|nr:MAG: hypothetical protein FD164_947 [Nitrospirota bacterium]
MSLSRLLTAQKSPILDKWFALILSTYPSDAAQFFRKKSTFTNPVGHTISQGIEDIFDGVISGAALEQYRPFLDNIIRVRAVQDFTASKAVAFVFHLKTAVRAVCLKKIAAERLHDDLLDLELRIDELSLMAFDIFMQCREKLYDLRANELRDRTLWILKRSGYVTEIEDEPGEIPGERINVKPTKEVN